MSLQNDDSAMMKALPQSAHWNSVRHFAKNYFSKVGYPTKKDEDFKYTSLGFLAESNFQPAALKRPSVARSWITEQLANLRMHDSYALCFVNGQLEEEGSDLQVLKKEGLLVSPLAKIIQESSRAQSVLNEFKIARLELGSVDQDGLEALNSCYAMDGVLIEVPAQKKLHKPLQIIFINQGEGVSVFPKIFLKASEGSQVELLESHSGSGDYLFSPVTECLVAESANLLHGKVLRDSEGATHVSRTRIYLQSSATYQHVSLALVGKLIRNSFDVYHMGEQSKSECYGVSLLNGIQHLDNHFSVDHRVGNCVSEQLFKSVVTDSAKSIFTGRIAIAPQSQKAQANQLSKSLLLSESCESNSRPQLQIYADDVKATHGATVGALSEEEVFYFQSRGIPAKQSREMLTAAFAKEALHQFKSPRIQKYLLAFIQAKTERMLGQ